MVALAILPTADLAKVQRLLDHGVTEEWWDKGVSPRRGGPFRRLTNIT
ncbi:hypothetical protein [Streptomyces tendae]